MITEFLKADSTNELFLEQQKRIQELESKIPSEGVLTECSGDASSK